MNKPAAKEPSMDEILSSIRQIIADDDASESPQAAETVSGPEETGFDIPEAPDSSEDDALALSADQIVDEAQNEATEESTGFDIPRTPDMSQDVSAGDADDEFSVPDMVVPDDIAFNDSVSGQGDEPFAAESAAGGDAGASEPAPMPDPGLSSEMADKLLEPTTDAAVKHAFSRLGSNVALGSNDLTIETMVREMLRPMLKEWLDENLPSIVEKMVEREIERLSRGS